MTGSYNEKLATQFAKRVRDTVKGPKTDRRSKTKILFQDIFPNVKLADGEGAADMWRIEGNPVVSYLATSPTGTATGIGAHLLIVDDIIKNPQEAYSDLALDTHEEWFNNNMMQRLEGNWKVIIIMTRWCKGDLAGRILESMDCEHMTYRAYEDTPEGRVFLCPEILDEESFNAKCKKMNRDIVMANYQQEPLDIKGRLYHEFNEYDPRELRLQPSELVQCVTDTADKGTDRLCAIFYVVRDGIAYVVDVLFSEEPMEITEVTAAQMHDKWGVRMSFVEANNGGRHWMRNVRRNMKKRNCVFVDKIQTANKEARIQVSSGWVQQYVWFPVGWKSLWRDFHDDVMAYNIKAKNEHDDGVDALAYLYSRCTMDNVIVQTSYESEGMPMMHSFDDAGQNDEMQEISYW